MHGECSWPVKEQDDKFQGTQYGLRYSLKLIRNSLMFTGFKLSLASSTLALIMLAFFYYYYFKSASGLQEHMWRAKAFLFVRLHFLEIKFVTENDSSSNNMVHAQIN